MSWDGLIFRAPPVASINDMPPDYQLLPLGTTEEIGNALQGLFPNQSHSFEQCCIEGDEFWLELNFSDRELDSVRTSIVVRCNAGAGVLPILKQVCDAFNARLFDNQMGDFADLEGNTRESMQTFAEWRDRNISS